MLPKKNIELFNDQTLGVQLLNDKLFLCHYQCSGVRLTCGQRHAAFYQVIPFTDGFKEAQGGEAHHVHG